MSKKVKIPETEEGTIVFNTDPVIIKNHYEMDYIHSYAQDSPFFIGLTKGVLLGSECKGCGYKYATPRKHCMYCEKETAWLELPKTGKIHTWTTCYYGGEAFLEETPYNLILVEFDGVDTLFQSRLIGMKEDEIKIGMDVKAKFLRNSKFKATDVYFVPST
ncbi:MAG: Zn-ribbon domain-containing OB-fold protein [Candidatus Scalindua sp.]